MDGATNQRPTQGGDPATIADAGGVNPNAASPVGGDWRTQLQPEERNRIVNMIMETLKKHLSVSVPEGLGELHKIAVRFEEKIYTAAINQSDYLRKISLKIQSMESQRNTEQHPGNAVVISNPSPPGPASVDSTAQTGIGIGDCQEELYQMIKSLKEQYFVEVNDLYNKVSMKIQYIDNHVPAQKASEQYEKMKGFKVMLERILHLLQVKKSSIQPVFKENIPIYERQILSILNSLRKPVQAPRLQTFEQSGAQAPSSNISQQYQTSQSLQQHDSHTDQKPLASLPSDYMNKGVVEAKELRCPFCKKKLTLQEGLPEEENMVREKGVAYDPTHKRIKGTSE